jgi:hypothetical protein
VGRIQDLGLTDCKKRKRKKQEKDDKNGAMDVALILTNPFD